MPNIIPIKAVIMFSFEADTNSKVHGANMGPTWVLSAPDGPHVDPMNLASRGIYSIIFVN